MAEYVLLGRKIYGNVNNFRLHREFLHIIENFTKEEAKDIILKIAQDYNEGNLFKKNEKYNINNKYYQLLAVGGYGIVFKTSLDPCEVLKISLTNDVQNKDYSIPNILISKHPNLENLIMSPKAYMEINLKGLYYYIYVQYFIVFVINRSIYLKTKIKKSDLDFKINYKIADELFNSTIDFKPEYMFLIEKYFENIYKIDFITHKIQLKRIFNMFKKYNQIDFKYCTIFDYAPFLSFNLLLDIRTLRISRNGIDSFDTLVLQYKSFPLYSLRILFLTISIFLLFCNKSSSFIHNDLKLDNILVVETKPYKLKFDDVEFVFDINFKYLINDFGISVLKPKCNKKYSWFYDMHFFVHMLFIYLEDRMSLDNEMTLFLFNTFIKPFCSKNINEIKNSNFKNPGICEDFFYKKKVKYDIKNLKTLLNNSLFEIFTAEFPQNKLKKTP